MDIFVYWQFLFYHSAEEASICQLHLTEDLLITLIFQKEHEYFYTLLSNFKLSTQC